MTQNVRRKKMMNIEKKMGIAVLVSIARISAAAEICIPRPPLSERWFSDLCFFLQLYATPAIAVALVRRTHDYTFLLLQSAFVVLCCAYTIVRMWKKHSPRWMYVGIIPIVILTGLFVTNKIWLFPYGG